MHLLVGEMSYTVVQAGPRFAIVVASPRVAEEAKAIMGVEIHAKEQCYHVRLLQTSGDPALVRFVAAR